MDWYEYAAFFFAGLFLANSIPHFIQGVSGERFQSPFASPPGVGESSPLINTLWGLLNLLIAYILFHAVGDFRVGMTAESLAAGLGFVLMSLVLSWHFGRVHAARDS